MNRGCGIESWRPWGISRATLRLRPSWSWSQKRTRVFARAEQGQREGERDAAAVEARDLAWRGHARERVEHGEHRAAVRGVGETLESGVEGEDQIAAANLQSVTKHGINSGHEIIFECRRPF